MDFYTNHRMMEAEAKRRIAELQNMATDSSVRADEENDAERTERYFQWFADRLAALAHRPHLGPT